MRKETYMLVFFAWIAISMLMVQTGWMEESPLFILVSGITSGIIVLNMPIELLRGYHLYIKDNPVQLRRAKRGIFMVGCGMIAIPVLFVLLAIILSAISS